MLMILIFSLITAALDEGNYIGFIGFIGHILESDSRLIPALAVMGPLRTPLAQVKNSSS